MSAARLVADAGAVRPFGPADLEPAMRVWSRACEASHPFLDRGFLRQSGRALRDGLGSGNTLIYDEEGVKGFACMSGLSLDAIFVDPAHHRRGIGTRLLERCRRDVLVMRWERP